MRNRVEKRERWLVSWTELGEEEAVVKGPSGQSSIGGFWPFGREERGEEEVALAPGKYG